MLTAFPNLQNRFQDRPEIYKQFLEILQTYQRESKPIQDVYAQVTHLFNTAPDLLEDFKQFLPESAAHAKAAAAKIAAEQEAAAVLSANQTPQTSYSRGEAKMPPVGNFAVPASTSKENKKRSRTNAAAPVTSQVVTMGESSARGVGPAGPGNKVCHSSSLNILSCSASYKTRPALIMRLLTIGYSEQN
jgi:paired amphipathic helix protein Sin3a